MELSEESEEDDAAAQPGTGRSAHVEVSGTWLELDWHGSRARAWLPTPLDERDLTLGPATVRATEAAAQALARVDDRLPANWEPLARLMLRAEGIASSSIEGLRAPVAEVALAEQSRADGDVGWIADNLATVEAASRHEELSVEVLHSWHRRLMGHSDLDRDLIGRFRPSPGWIGGSSPVDAVYVPPPPDRIDDLMSDLVGFANGESTDPVTQAAVLHAQFETIHPYGDGNGRIGRVLVGWTLRRRGVVRRLPPPISVLMARDVGGYLAGLHRFRHDEVDPWVGWFAGITARAATQSRAMLDEVAVILDDWRALTAHLRSDAAARRAVELLPESPVLNARVLARALAVSERAARSALDDLVVSGILEAMPARTGRRGRPSNWFAATALLDATRRWTG